MTEWENATDMAYQKIRHQNEKEDSIIIKQGWGKFFRKTTETSFSKKEWIEMGNFMGWKLK